MGKDLKGKELGPGYSQMTDGRYRRSFRFNGKQRTVYGNTLKECKENYKAVLLKIERGEFLDRATITLNQYFDAWLEQQLSKKIIKESSYSTYKRQYTYIRKELGQKKIDKITTSDVKNLQMELIKTGKYKPATINAVMGLLSSVFKEMVRDGLIVRNVCDVIRPVKEDAKAERTNARALSKEEEELFLSYAKGTWYYNAIRLLFATGMRSGEMRALTWRDFDTKNNLLHIRHTVTVDKEGKTAVSVPKTQNSMRSIPLNETIKGIISDQKAQNDKMFGSKVISLDDYIFKSQEGLIVSRNALKSAFNEICDKIKKSGKHFERISPHSCRHTFITQNILNGQNEYVVKDIVGHAHSAKVTVDVYLHKNQEAMNEMMQQLDKAN